LSFLNWEGTRHRPGGAWALAIRAGSVAATIYVLWIGALSQIVGNATCFATPPSLDYQLRLVARIAAREKIAIARQARDALISAGFAVDFRELPGYEHNTLYTRGDSVVQPAWAFLKIQALEGEPKYHVYNY